MNYMRWKKAEKAFLCALCDASPRAMWLSSLFLGNLCAEKILSFFQSLCFTKPKQEATKHPIMEPRYNIFIQ